MNTVAILKGIFPKALMCDKVFQIMCTETISFRVQIGISSFKPWNIF